MGGIWRKAEARWRNVTHQKESSIASCDVQPCDAGVHCRRVQPVTVRANRLHRAPACPNAFDDRETPAKQKRDEKRCSDIFARQQQQMHSKFKTLKPSAVLLSLGFVSIKCRSSSSDSLCCRCCYAETEKHISFNKSWINRESYV